MLDPKFLALQVQQETSFSTQVSLREDRLDPGEVRAELRGLLQASAGRSFRLCKGQTPRQTHILPHCKWDQRT